jgi:hypothetical protein
MKKYFFSLFIIATLLLSVLTTCKKDTSVTGVFLNKKSLTLEIGNTETLIVTVFPENATNKIVNWSSSNLKIVEVVNGTVSAKELGTATVTVITEDGNYKAECLVTVVSVEPEEKGIIINGVKWATRNLAAHGKFVEKPEDFGALFQWGRIGDGHEQRTSQTYSNNDPLSPGGTVSGDENFDIHGQIANTHSAYGKFIITTSFFPDWRDPHIDDLWNSGTETAPVKTANDPCPKGWRLPTQTELATLEGNGEWVNSPIPGRYFGSDDNLLFLPAAGDRRLAGFGCYWSSSSISTDIFGNMPYCLHFDDSSPRPNRKSRGSAYSVRCVAEH